jgi:serine/threonine protein kinase
MDDEINVRGEAPETYAMPADPKLVRNLFVAVAELPAADRGTYLTEHCDDDAELRAAVERLLAAYQQPANVLDWPAPVIQTVDFPSIRERPGTKIGPYKLMEQIGEGGFGLVFVAEQTQPVRRMVALKIIKPGMDSKQVIARFEAERQALALMDHPNIARVLDAGATESARPYFVMELVRGIPITDYCDQNQLTPNERLELFVSVCQAIQHAHQKGIIHRDIKPSNVLVTSHDGKPVAKVIDFGVAKAIHQHLTERTIYTNFAQMIGTPLYMSPEQAEMSGLDIDTRSDIYSLGVLLYELLTGTTPLERRRFASAAYDEIRRVIREEEPPRPSQRLSTSDTLPSLAANRKTEPARLSRMFKGELDWVVMKALEKDRTRRYETANGLARDIQRYLANEMVEARPPSTVYRLRKFASNHKMALATAAAIAVLLVAGIVGTTVGLIRAERQKQIAEAAAEEARAARDSEAEQRRLAQEMDALDRMRKLAFQYYDARQWDLALPLYEELVKLTRAKYGANDPRTIYGTSTLAWVSLYAGKPDRTLPLAKEAYEKGKATWGNESKDTSLLLNRLTQVFVMVGAYQAWFGQDKELADTCGQALEFAKGTSDPTTADRASKICWLRPTPNETRRQAALALARKAVELGKDHELFRWFQMGLGMGEYRCGHFAQADAALLAVENADKIPGYLTGTSAFYRAMSLFQQGKKDEARRLATEAAAKMKPLPKDEKDPLAGNAYNDDLILWMAYKEAKALIQFEAAPTPPNGK